MLDKVVIKHLDEMDLLEDDIDKDFEAILSEIDIDEIIDDPMNHMMALAEDMQTLLEEKYYDRAVANGITFARQITEDGDIKIDRSKDPNKNEDIL